MIDKGRIQRKILRVILCCNKVKSTFKSRDVAACIVMWEKEIAIAHRRCLLGLWTQFISKGIAIYQIVALSW